MTKRENIIKAAASKLLLEVLNDYYEIAIQEDWESITDFESAFYYVSDCTDKGDQWENLQKAVRLVHIALGDFKEVDPSTYLHGKPCFKLKGKYYKWVG